MNRLVDGALGKLRSIEAGKYYYKDDDAFVIQKSEGSRLSEMDLTVHPGAAKAHRLLKNDGTIVTEIVKARGSPIPEAPNAPNPSTKVRNF